MEHQLWQKILDFDFDRGGGEYTFTLRLASENNWPHHFTQLALLEYRKFMYLAATHKAMVSPSEIVDIVWHQHLIFTQSYREFCAILRKEIQHIPSTHNPAEAARFKSASALTTNRYNEVFGEQPKSVWGYRDILEALQLKQASFSIKTFYTYAIIAIIVLLIPSVILLEPLYIHIGNPGFLFGYCALAAGTFIALKQYNTKRLQQMFNDMDTSAFVFNLEPYELIRLKYGSINAVVLGSLNELIGREILQINTDKTFTLTENATAPNPTQQQTIDMLYEYEHIPYEAVAKLLARKPVFSVIDNSMKQLHQHIIGSKKFGAVFYLNIIVASVVLLAGYARFFTGILRGKDSGFIFILCCLLTYGAIKYLISLYKAPFTKTIPELYKASFITKEHIDTNWQWRYFLEGNILINGSLLAIAYPPANSGNNGDSGSSCGSDGGGCGGGCGGCGGGD